MFSNRGGVPDMSGPLETASHSQARVRRARRRPIFAVVRYERAILIVQQSWWVPEMSGTLDSVDHSKARLRSGRLEGVSPVTGR